MTKIQALSLLVTIFVWALQPAFATIRHPNRPESEYRALGNQFPSVVTFAPQGGGGVLIAPTWILTAAHCVDYDASDGGVFSVLVNGENHAVKEIVLHSRYKPGFADNDIALVRLDRQVTRETSLPIYVGTGEHGLPCVFVGYGWCFPMGFDFKPALVPENEKPGIRRAGTNQVSRTTDKTLHTTADLVAGVTRLEYHTAGGDSGGPLIIEIDGKPFIAGIVSGSTSDDPAESDYSRVSAYSRWIEDVTGENFGVSRPERAWIWGGLIIGCLCVAGMLRLRRQHRLTRPEDAMPA